MEEEKTVIVRKVYATTCKAQKEAFQKLLDAGTPWFEARMKAKGALKAMRDAFEERVPDAAENKD